jgi:hypothetical protein
LSLLVLVHASSLPSCLLVELINCRDSCGPCRTMTPSPRDGSLPIRRHGWLAHTNTRARSRVSPSARPPASSSPLAFHSNAPTCREQLLLIVFIINWSTSDVIYSPSQIWVGRLQALFPGSPLGSRCITDRASWTRVMDGCTAVSPFFTTLHRPTTTSTTCASKTACDFFIYCPYLRSSFLLFLFFASFLPQQLTCFAPSLLRQLDSWSPAAWLPWRWVSWVPATPGLLGCQWCRKAAASNVPAIVPFVAATFSVSEVVAFGPFL